MVERVVPVLGIDEYDEAIDYYVDKLGFELVFEHRHEPGFPVFMQVRRGELILDLSEHSKGHPGSELYVFVDDVMAWYELCQEQDVPVEKPPQRMPWGSTEMVLIDPFRNLLRVSQIETHDGAPTPNR